MAVRWGVFAVAVLVTCFAGQHALAEKLLTIHYIERQVERPPTLSNLHAPPDDQGMQGARLGARDINAGGQFTGHRISLVEHIVAPDDDFSEALKNISGDIGDTGLIIANMPAIDLLALADQRWAKGALILNAGARDDHLRQDGCRANLLHTSVSRAMLADALTQFLKRKRWDEWFLIEGRRPADRAFADAVRRSARKFGTEIVERKQWQADADMRRNAQAEVPPFTQGEDHDVMIVADELGDFGEYILYHTWEPRPVAGTQGLTPIGWHQVMEQWGAAQLQRRFVKLAKRPMTDVDYAGWLAMVSLGEALLRGNVTATPDIAVYLLSDTFKLAGFKGRRLSFRPWSGQMRQPVPLVHRGALVSMSPQPKFLHRRTDLDTLGFDKAESKCSAR